MMEKKQMMIADVNLVFGKKEEPLLKWIDEIILPALNSGKERIASESVKFLFEDCEVVDFEGELVLKGVLIKDMVLDVMSEYNKDSGLQKTNKHFPSSPYSIFMIFLKNHRMMLVKNQSSSPDIRSFKTSLKYTLKEYILKENERRRKVGDKLLPHARLNISGIKTTESVKESLKDVEKITELTFQFFPLNAEWDTDSVFGGIDSAIRKVICSKKGRMIFPSPNSIDGVARVIEETDGLVKTKMRVRYKADSEKGQSQRTGTIKDNEISNVSNIEISKELDTAFEDIFKYKKDYASLNVTSSSNLELYEKYRKSKMVKNNE